MWQKEAETKSDKITALNGPERISEARCCSGKKTNGNLAATLI